MFNAHVFSVHQITIKVTLSLKHFNFCIFFIQVEGTTNPFKVKVGEGVGPQEEVSRRPTAGEGGISAPAPLRPQDKSMKNFIPLGRPVENARKCKPKSNHLRARRSSLMINRTHQSHLLIFNTGYPVMNERCHILKTFLYVHSSIANKFTKLLWDRI